jgi:hypothetical protein
VNSRNIKSFGLLAGTCALLLAGCASEPPRRAAMRPGERMGMQPAPPRASQALAPRQADLIAQASAFESFMRHARGIDGEFSGPAEVAQAVQTGAAHAPGELESGMVAYAALAALQEPSFVNAVRAERDGGALARRIEADPAAALGLPGAHEAAARASGALYAQGSALAAEGQKVKHASYAIQHQVWSTARTDGAAQLVRVKRAGEAGYRPESGDGERLAEALSQAGRRSGTPSALVTHSVALAALSLLGQENRDRSLLADVRTGSCLRVAKLNYHQCLAAAGTRYEDVFCLGQHAMIDPGQCVIEATEIHAGHSPAPARRPAVTRTSYRR